MAKGKQTSAADLIDRLRAIHSMASIVVTALTVDATDEGSAAEVLQMHVCDALESEIGRLKRNGRVAALGAPQVTPKAPLKKSRAGKRLVKSH